MAARMIEDVDGRMVRATPKVLARDCFVVATAELSPLVRSFVMDWNQRRPADGGKVTAGRTRRRRATFVAAYAWLEQESGVPQSTLRDVYRGPSRRQWTPLAEADAIIMAIGRPDLISADVRDQAGSLVASGAISVVANPRGCC